jgi:hypothetical protein
MNHNYESVNLSYSFASTTWQRYKADIWVWGIMGMFPSLNSISYVTVTLINLMLKSEEKSERIGTLEVWNGSEKFDLPPMRYMTPEFSVSFHFSSKLSFIFITWP